MNENSFVFEQYCQKNFLDLLNDAIILVEFAESIGTEVEETKIRPEYGGWPEISLSRSAIISSAFCLEAGANCCIESLGFRPKLKSAVERKSVFAKYEIYLEETVPNKTLNQNKNIVDRAREVMLIRDSYAHPKVLPKSVSKKKDTDVEEAFPIHKLKKNFMCTHVHAVSTLKSTVDFLDYFFRDRCGLSDQQVCEMLIEDTRYMKGSVEIPGSSVFQVPEFIRAKEKWGLPLEFFGGP